MKASRLPGRVTLLGMMGSGKTTTGSALAQRLGWPLCDSDLEITARTGDSGAVLAAREGVAALHDLEADILLDALDASEPSVVAAAASVVDSPRCRAALAKSPLVVWLEVPAETLMQRARGGSHRRSMTEEVVMASLERRSRAYAEVADLRVDATTTTARLVEIIIDELGHRDEPSVTEPR